MQIKYCEYHQIYNMDCMDPMFAIGTLVNTKSVTTEEYIIKFFGIPKEGIYSYLSTSGIYLTTQLFYNMSHYIFYNL
jgi:hypothetical protein